MHPDDREHYHIEDNDDKDMPYTMIEDLFDPYNNQKIFICSSLRVLLKAN